MFLVIVEGQEVTAGFHSVLWDIGQRMCLTVRVYLQVQSLN
jgi:hypothetical protein